ncbi:sugar transferase, partial [Campylobacter coli]|nr:sugar transferase [Campylobacter coli]
LFYKNYAGSFSEVFPYFFSNAKSLYPYISYIAAQIYMYHRDYFMAYKIIKDIAYLNPSFINFSKKLAIKSYKYLNISLKNKDQLIKNQIVQIKELKNKVLQLQKDFDSINLLKNDLLEIQKKQLDVLIKDREQMIVNRFRYGKAKNRIQNQLSYKLGQAMIVNSKSLLGYIRMPFALSYIKDKHKQEQKIYQEKIKKDPSLKLPPLEDYPDYKEALKEKECLTYKLGEALIKASNNWYGGGYIKLLLEIRKLKKEFKKK